MTTKPITYCVRKTFATGPCLLVLWLTASLNAQEAFPYLLPKERPDRPLSAALKRTYSAYRTPRQEDNELYSQFKYTELKGFDYNDCDGTITRRDPSKVIRVNGKYYVWYTHRHTETMPVRTEKTQKNIPSRDWDLSEIWYATSEDGFAWQEQRVAVPIPTSIRSVATADILIWKGRYYLYYQAFPDDGDGLVNDCFVTVSHADSPEGPWTPTGKVVVPNGAEGEWDHLTLHDPCPLVHNGRIYLYYKSDFDDTVQHFIKMAGLAVADDPLGPFEKHSLNPVLNHNHKPKVEKR